MIISITIIIVLLIIIIVIIIIIIVTLYLKDVGACPGLPSCRLVEHCRFADWEEWC